MSLERVNEGSVGKEVGVDGGRGGGGLSLMHVNGLKTVRLQRRNQI